MLHFSEEEFAARREKLTANMRENKCDAVLLFAQESMFWLTGYDTFGFCFFQCLVVKANGEMALLTRSADLRQARHTSNIENIVIWIDGVHANPVNDLRDLLSEMDLLGAHIGVEYGASGLNAAQGKMLDEKLSTFANLQDATDAIHGLRLVKSAEEIKYIQKAAKSADLALDAAMATAKAGVDEGKILAAMQGAIFEAGGDYAGNEFIIGSGDDALLCRYKSGRRKLSRNDQLTLEWAGAHAHYHAAMMRTLIIGKPRPEHEMLFDATRQALLACEEVMVPGNTFGDVFNAHARTFDGLGLSRHRLNACGYSLGAKFAPCWMDGPMFFAGNEQAILPDMSLFAHMIIMDSDSGSAMCLGQSYLTTEGKPKSLSAKPLEMITL